MKIYRLFIVSMFILLAHMAQAQLRLDVEGESMLRGKTTIEESSSFGNPFDMQTDATDSWMGIYNSNGYRGYMGIYTGDDDMDFGTGGGNATGKTHLVTQATPRLTVDESGDIGIGTTSPSAHLHLVGNDEQIRLDGTSPYLSFYNGASYEGYLWHTGGSMIMATVEAEPLYFRTNLATRMTVDAIGNVGIGTIVPSSKLHISDGDVTIENNSLSTPAINLSGTTYGNSIAQTNGTQEWRSVVWSDNAYRIVKTSGSTFTPLTIFNNTFQDALVLAQNGVGIGTSTPGNYKFKIVHDAFGLNLENATGGNDWELYATSATSENLFLYNNGSSLGNFDGTTGAYSSTSDRRLKKNIRPIESVLAKVNQLEASRYFYKEDEKNTKECLGFIAQDVELLFPELISIGEDERNKGVYTMDYSGFGTIAIKAVQELSSENEELKTEVIELKERLAKLEAAIEALTKE